MDLESGDSGVIHQNDNVDQTAPIDDLTTNLLNNAKITIQNLQETNQEDAAQVFQDLLNLVKETKNSLNSSENHRTELETANNEISTQLDAFKKQNLADKETIQALEDKINDTTEIETAWKERDAALNRELLAKQRMETSHIDIEEKDEAAKAPTPLKDDGEIEGGLEKYKTNILREYDRLNSEVAELKRRLQLQRLYGVEMDRKKEEMEQKIVELTKLLDKTTSESLKENMLLDQLKVQVVEINKDKNNITDSFNELKRQHENLISEKDELHLKLTKTTNNLELKTSRLNEVTSKLAASVKNVTYLSRERDEMRINQTHYVNTLKLNESQLKKLTSDNGTLLRDRDAYQRKLIMANESKSQLSHQVTELKNTIFTYEKNEEASKKALEKSRQETSVAINQRDTIQKNLQKADAILDEQRSAIKRQERITTLLTSEIKTHLSRIHELNSSLATSERHCNKLETAAIIQEKIVQEKLAELEMKEAQITDLKDLVFNSTQKLAHLQQQYDIISSDRLAIRRELNATIEDGNLLRERLNVTAMQREQLREDISRKEHDLHTVNKTVEKLNRDKMALSLEIQNIRTQIQSLEIEFNEKVRDNGKLIKTLSDDERKFKGLQNELNAIKREKDLLGSQLVRRNDELGLLNEKLQINELAINKGESEYNIRLNDIRLLKIEISNLQTQNNLLKKGLSNTADMRTEVLQLHRELTQERVKCKVLEDSLVLPENVHRWRQLEGKDPDHFELITKNRVLQNRLLLKSVAMAQQDEILKQAEAQREKLKESLDRNSASQLRRKLILTRRQMNARIKALKASAAESKASGSELQRESLVQA